MKLQSLTLENFMIHRSLAVHWGGTSPLVLVCGPNEHGKSALVEAMDFALRGDCHRLETKGARKSLITDGAKKGSVTLSIGDASLQRNIADGKVAALAGDFAIAAGNADFWPFMTNHQAFSALSADDRRRALFAALNVGTSASDITMMLAKRGHANSRITLVADKINRSMDAGVTFAKSKASEARGAWQEIAGENYGSLKAEGWKPATPEVPANAQDRLQELRDQRAELVTQREALVVERTKVAETDRKFTTLQSDAIAARTRMSELGCKVGVEYSGWVLELEEYSRLASEARGVALAAVEKHQNDLDAIKVAPLAKPTTYGCPCCSSVLVLNAGKLEEYVEGELPAADLAEEERLTALLNEASARAATENQNIARTQEKLREVRPLLEKIKAFLALQAEEGDQNVQARSIEAINADISAIDQQGSAITLERNGLQASVDAAAEVEAKASRAAELHADVEAWTNMAADLEPSGIPAELLAKALLPLNERLMATAKLTGWPVVRVGDDMGIHYGQRPFGLASESGRWRADAMLTEAVLFLAGVRSMVLDRMDVLDMPSRSALLKWMHGLAQRGEIESALVLATLKEAPKLPATYNVLWLGEEQPGA